MNAGVGDVEMEEAIVKFGVPGVNWAGRRMVQLCTEAGLIAGNALFKKRVNKYTWLRAGLQQQKIYRIVVHGPI
jgi:hypothetical protein